MEIIVDSYNTSSVVHEAQDYVLHTPYHEYPFIAISDGCSGSKHSDIAARLLVWKAYSVFIDSVRVSRYYFGDIWTEKVLFPYDDFGLRVINQADACRKQHFPAMEGLVATLIFGVALPDGIHVYMYGDGHILAKRKGIGVVEHQIVSQESNAPYYLSYWIHGSSTSYKAIHGLGCITRSHYQHDSEGYHLVGEEYKNFTDPLEWVFPYNKYSSVALVTDGVSDFRTHSSSIYEEKREYLVHLVKGLLEFKTTTGQFVVRRTRKLLKELRKKDVVPYDDFSVGCFVVKEDENGNT